MQQPTRPQTILVIPARIGSSRFPEKPLAKIKGHALLERVWKIANAVQGLDHIFVATDSEKIATFARGFGAEVVMTDVNLPNGTARTHAVLQSLQQAGRLVGDPIAINLQGDAVLTPPWVIQAVLNEMVSNLHIPIATPAVKLDWQGFDAFQATKVDGKVSGTLVVLDQLNRALYFSKGTIPHLRDREKLESAIKTPPIYRHIGLYAYRKSLLDQYVAWGPSPLEQIEQLEQLRVLENGMEIRVVPVDYRGRTHASVDNPEDIDRVEAIINREGELVLW